MAAPEYFFSLPLANYNNTDDKKEAFQTAFERQLVLISNLNTNHNDISGSIVTYETKRNDLLTNYQDFSSNSEIDPSRIWLDKEDRLTDVSDGVKEDIHIMIMEQNNAYIIGMITLATVLITTYLVIKK